MKDRVAENVFGFLSTASHDLSRICVRFKRTPFPVLWIELTVWWRISGIHLIFFVVRVNRKEGIFHRIEKELELNLCIFSISNSMFHLWIYRKNSSLQDTKGKSITVGKSSTAASKRKNIFFGFSEGFAKNWSL